MTPEQHNKYLGLSHLAFVAFQTVMGVLMASFMLVIFSTMPASRRGDEPPAVFFIVMTCFVLLFTVGWAIPSMVASYALLKRKKWAKVAAIVAAAFAATHVPVGTLVCVYTFWFLFSEPGKVLYESTRQTLPPPPPRNLSALDPQPERGRQYAPPDWR